MRDSRASGKKPINEVEKLRARVAILESENRKLTKPSSADEELGKAWAEWEKTFDAARDSIMVIDSEFKIIQANLATSRLLGKPVDEIVGQTCWQVVHGTEEPPEKCPFKAALHSKNHEEMELHVPEKDIWMEVSADPILDDQGNINRTIHIIRDITERKLAEVALKDRERELSIRNRIAGIFLTIPDEKMYAKVLDVILEVMASEFGTFGYFDDAGNFVCPALTRTIYWDKCNVPDKEVIFERGQFAGIWGQAVKERKVLYCNTGPFDTPKGHIRIENTMVAPIVFRDEIISAIHIANKPGGYDEKDCALLKTVAKHMAPILNARLERDRKEKERKKAAEALAESEARLSVVFEKVPAVLLLVDQDRRVHLVNEAATRFARRTANQMTGLRGGDALRCLHSLDDPKGCGYGPFCDICVVRNTVLETFETDKSFYQREAQLPFDIDGETNELSLLVSTATLKVLGRQMALVCLEDITERKKAKEEIERLAKFPAENPCPVLRISGHGTVIYANKASAPLLKAWGCRVGESLPERWCEFVLDALSSAQSQQTEVKCDGQIFFLTFALVTEANYVNVYGLDITERKKAKDRLLKDQAKLKAMASKTLLTEGRERQEIASGLHDDIIQPLVFLDIKLKSLVDSDTDSRLMDSFKEMRHIVSELIPKTRTLTFDLSYPVLYELGLEAAIERWLATYIRERHGLDIVFTDDRKAKPLDDEVRTALFKAIKELLTNIVKHAHANVVEISVAKEGDNIAICVKDDGEGFELNAKIDHLDKSSGFGLFSIREQLDHLGGNCNIKSEPGRGTSVLMTAPLKKEGRHS